MSNTRAIVSSYIGVLVFAALVFLGAGKVMYWQGLLYTALAVIGTTLNHVLVRPGSDITAERERAAPLGEPWDKKILGVHMLVTVVTFVVAGLDSGRFGWSGPVPSGVTVAGVVLMLAGQLLFALAKRENDFFSSTVRIQTERGHKVCDTGPYRFVRHPGYVGMLVSLLAFPLVMNAFWAFVPASVGIALLLARTVLEDRFLERSLAGYEDYARKIRWRLVPFVF